MRGRPQSPPSPDPTTGELRAHWPITDTLKISSDWLSGYYTAKVSTSSVVASGSSYVPFILGAPQASRILVVVPVTTWQAYNNWGGKSLYAFNSTGHVAATHVSFDRPYSETTGYTNLLYTEYPLIGFLERGGYDVSYTTDAEIDRNPQELEKHRLVIVAGHSEYWTKGIRDTFEHARDTGTNLAFLGANDGYWQMRFEQNRRTIVEYRFAALDPEQDVRLQTVEFRALRPPRPECELLGVQYQGQPRSGSQRVADYQVNAAALSDPWFQDTDLMASTTLRNLVGLEWDGIQQGCATAPLTTFFHATGPPHADAVRYTAGSGARVFSAGSLHFSWGLNQSPYPVPFSDSRLQRFMANALTDLQRPALPVVLKVRVARDGINVGVTVRPDPRILGVRIFRHPGPDDFALGQPGVALVCTTRTGRCVDHARLARGVYRFAAASFDRWSSSALVLSRSTVIATATPGVH